MNKEELKLFLLENFGNNIITCYQILKNKYNNIYNNIIDETSYLDSNIKFTERLYHIINNLNEVPKCKICNNNNPKFNGYNKGYSVCCSSTCSNINRQHHKKIIFNGNINRHDIKNFLISDIGINNIINSYQLLKYKYKNIYDGVILLTSYLSDVVFTERLYHILNDLYDIPKCSNNDCFNKVNFNGYNNGYLKFCSYKCSSNSSETRKKYEKTCLEKYGEKYIFKTEHVKKLIKHKFLNKFIPLFIKQLNYLNINLKDEQYITEHYKHKWGCSKCNLEFIQTWNEIQQGYVCPKCFPRNQGYSKDEIKLSEFIESLNLNIIKNNRNILNGRELDIYIPEKNIAIEFDGLYYHNELFKDKNYHLNKTIDCKGNNIQLIHIFEDEFILKQDIVKSKLKQILNLNYNLPKIYARKCEIKEIDSKLKNEFLNKYHLQGEDSSNIKLGAFYNNELISVMTFSHGSISKGSKLENDVWELNRFCSDYNYHIIGIASKLLSYFKKNYEWKEIYSYADRRWSVGNLYYKLGFELDHTTKPNYWYVKGLNRIHRFNLRKRPEEPRDIPEWVLRTKEGYYRIWDCGHYKFKLIK